jgi:hypothetical protein
MYIYIAYICMEHIALLLAAGERWFRALRDRGVALIGVGHLPRRRLRTSKQRRLRTLLRLRALWSRRRLQNRQRRLRRRERRRSLAIASPVGQAELARMSGRRVTLGHGSVPIAIGSFKTTSRAKTSTESRHIAFPGVSGKLGPSMGIGPRVKSMARSGQTIRTRTSCAAATFTKSRHPKRILSGRGPRQPSEQVTMGLEADMTQRSSFCGTQSSRKGPQRQIATEVEIWRQKT